MLFCLAFLMIQPVRAAQREAVLLEIAEPIGAATASFIQKGLDEAENTHAVCCIIKLDTPGGSLESMRRIVMAILDSKIPVVVYVAPAGARAASAGRDDNQRGGRGGHGASHQYWCGPPGRAFWH